MYKSPALPAHSSIKTLTQLAQINLNFSAKAYLGIRLGIVSCPVLLHPVARYLPSAGNLTQHTTLRQRQKSPSHKKMKTDLSCISCGPTGYLILSWLWDWKWHISRCPASCILAIYEGNPYGYMWSSKSWMEPQLSSSRRMGLSTWRCYSYPCIVILMTIQGTRAGWARGFQARAAKRRGTVGSVSGQVEKRARARARGRLGGWKDGWASAARGLGPRGRGLSYRTKLGADKAAHVATAYTTGSPVASLQMYTVATCEP